MIKQRSPEWFNLRLGKVTASRINAVITEKENSISRKKYKEQLSEERRTKKVKAEKRTYDQYLGVIRESEAKKLYAKLFQPVIDCGFFDHPDIIMSGASPDGLVGDDGQIEIKCPNKSNHQIYLKKMAIPKKYFAQIQFQLSVTKRKWCDFISFNPEISPPNQIFVKRVYKDQEYIMNLEHKVIRFLKEVEELK